MSENRKRLRDLDSLILDEADRLNEEGFWRDLRDVLSVLPRQRRTGLFSATLDNINQKTLQKFGLRNPALITLKKQANSRSSKALEQDGDEEGQNESNFTIPSELENYFLILPSRLEKIGYLVNFINAHRDSKIMVFFNTCSSVEFYAKLLRHTLAGQFQFPKAKQHILALFGKMKQHKRSRVFERFDEGKKGVLMTTDVAGRGADFSNVDWVIQVDPPQSPEFFVHRVGRTARSGRHGRALVLLDRGEKGFLEFLGLKGVQMRWVGELGLAGSSVRPNFKDKHAGIATPEKQKRSESASVAPCTLSSESISRALTLCRASVLTDRDFHVKSLKAFVSFVRSFKEHRLRSIFQIDKLDWRSTASSFFLGRVPLIKETRRFLSAKENLIIDPVYNEKLKKLEFKDANQAKHYLLKATKLEIKRKGEKEKKEKLRKRAFKESGLKARKSGRSFQQRKQAKQRALARDFDDFAEEERLYKRVKQGKMSQTDFDRIMSEKEQYMER